MSYSTTSSRLNTLIHPLDADMHSYHRFDDLVRVPFSRPLFERTTYRSDFPPVSMGASPLTFPSLTRLFEDTGLRESFLSIETLPLTFNQLYDPARHEEQKSHFNAIFNAVARGKAALSVGSLADTASSITMGTIAAEKHNRLYHLLCRLGALDPQFPQESLYEKAEEASHSSLTVEEICARLGISLHPPSLQLIASFEEQERRNKAFEDPAFFALEKATLTAKLSSLEQLLSSVPRETEALEDKNHDILITLEDVYSSPLYEALCMSKSPLIDILHSIAIEQYTNTTLAPALEKIGQKIGEKATPLPKRVDAIWNRLEKIGIDNGIITTLLHYSFLDLIKIGLPYVVYKIAQFLSLNSLLPSLGNERSILGNTPGALTDEIQQNNDLSTRTIRTIVLSAPTLGEQVAPEFRAALQALENNQLSPSDAPYLTWAYTNLQNFSFTPEHTSSIALMALQNHYPLSFQGITLPQRPLEPSTADFSDVDVRHHLSLIFKEHTSSLDNRGIDSDPGYYFPKPFLDRYRFDIEAIAVEAYRIIANQRGRLAPGALKTAFTKLFHLGLTRLHEKVTLNLTAARTHRTAIAALRSTVCASCIDRGGMMNAAYINGLSPDGSLDALTDGVCYGRAILSHRRAPIKKMTESLSNLFSVVSSADVKKFLDDITPEFSSRLHRAA